MRGIEFLLSNRNLILRASAALVCCAIAASARPALAVDHTWLGGAANSWHVAANWSPATVPTTSDVVIFPDLGGAYSVTSNFANSFAAASITISTPDGFNLIAPLGQTVFLDTGDLTRTSAAASNQIINTRVIINGNAVWSISGTGIFTVPAIQENVSGLSFTKTGTGTLNISGSSGSTYSGGTTINGGILKVDADGLGSGAVTVASGASLQIIDDVDRSLTLNGTGAGGIGALNGNGTFGGDILLATNSAIGVGSPNGMIVTGIISDGALTRSLTKLDDGVLALSGANTYKGGTTVSGGTLQLSANTAAGSGSIVVSSGATVLPDDGRTIANQLSINGIGVDGNGVLRLDAGAATWSGNINLQSNSSIGAQAGELLITGNMGGAFALTKIGAGTVTIAATNSITGQLLVSEGALKVRHPLATSSAGTVVSSGAAVAVQETIANAGINVSRPISLNGDGGGGGALRNISSNNTWSGAVTLQSNTSIGSDAGQLTISGAISGAFTLTKVGPGALSISSAANSYGNTFVEDGTLIVNSSSLPAAGTATVHSGGTLQVAGPATFSRTVTLFGPGFEGGGALRHASGNINWNSLVSIAASAAIGVDSGELRMVGGINGISSLAKVGLGKLTFPTANTYIGATEVDQGILSIEIAGALPSTSATSVLDGAALELRGGIAPANNLSLSGTGILGAGALRNAAGNNTWSGPITLQSDAAIGADPGTQLTLSGVISDVGIGASLSKVGAGTLVLTTSNTYKGGTLINGGILSISANDQLGAVTGAVSTNNGGKLLVTANTTSGRTFNLNTGSLQVASGATLTYSGAIVNGGFLRGPGTHAIGASASFNGVTALPGNIIIQSSATTLSNFTNSGSFTSNAAVTWDGGYNTSAGSIVINNTFNTTAFENNGNMSINGGGNAVNTANNFTSGGGSRIDIAAGGTLNVTGNALDLNGALLVNNGTITGITNVNFGSLAKGSGVYGVVNVTDGGKFSPGNSPGAVSTGAATWGTGGNYTVEISDALAGPGLGWDLWNIDGDLLIDPSFSISLATLEGAAAGPAAHFDATRDYHWLIARSRNDLDGIDLSSLDLDSSFFVNRTGTGHFYLSTEQNIFYVNFTSVPEPLAALLLPAALILLARRK